VKKIFLYTLIFVAIVWTPVLAQAASVDSLYSAGQDVNNQSKSLRSHTIKALFKSVLIKISGQSDIATNPLIAAQLPKAMSYITNFNYQGVAGQQTLVASFSETLVDRLLKQAGVSIWGSQRPSAMLWLAVETPAFERVVVADEPSDTTALLLTAHANNRGMPILLPLWDLEDQLALSVTEVWGLFPDSVAQANARYATDFMILAKVVSHGLTYQLHWAIYKQDADGFNYDAIVASGLDEFVDHQQALTALIDQTSDFFAQQYSVDTSIDSAAVEFTVTNIDSIGQYVAVLNYLNSLKAIETVYLKRNEQQKFTFSATLLGSLDSLTEVLQLEKQLLGQYDKTLGYATYLWRD